MAGTDSDEVTSGLEVMVKLGPNSRVSVESTGHDEDLPILEIISGAGISVMVTQWVGIEQSGPLTSLDLAVADQLLVAARVYRNGLARVIGEPEL